MAPSSDALPPARLEALPTCNESVDMKAPLGGAPALKGALHTHTPEHESESRQNKRLRPTILPAEPTPCPEAFVGPAWLPYWGRQLGSWLGTLFNLHAKCSLIPGEAVVRLALALLQ